MGEHVDNRQKASALPATRGAAAPEAARGEAFARIAPVDGLRGVAILLVMLYHYEARSWPYQSGLGMPFWAVIREGWMGVDLFFAISGFLITGILLDSRSSPHYFRTFYVRRTLRIFPLYYAYLVIAFLIAPMLAALAPQFAAAWPPTALHVQLWFWSYLGNVPIAFGGYSSSPNFVAHLWSLAVEEQFYLIWPAVVLITSRRGLVVVCLACIALATAARIGVQSTDFPSAAILVRTLLRTDALAMGALVALAVRSRKGSALLARFARPLALAAFIPFVFLFTWRGLVDSTDKIVGTVGLTIVSLFFAAAVALAATEQPRTLVYRVLTLRVLTEIGKYSYAMYVLHVAVRLILENLGFSLDALSQVATWRPVAHALYVAGNVGCTFVIAVLSWHVLEQPFLGLKRLFPYSPRSQNRSTIVADDRAHTTTPPRPSVVGPLGPPPRDRT